MSARKFPYLFAGEQELDCALALHKLKEWFHIDRLLLAGGAVMNASLLQNGLIDELSVLVAPVVDGGAPITSTSITSTGAKPMCRWRKRPG